MAACMPDRAHRAWSARRCRPGNTQRAVQVGLLLVGTALTSSCTDLTFGGGETITGTGPVVAQPRSVAPFIAVSNATEAAVHIVQSGLTRVRLEGQGNLLPQIRTEVTGGVLRITTAPGVTLVPTEPLLIEVEIRDLTRIESSSGGPISAPLLDARRLEIRTSGSAEIDLPSLVAETLVVIGSGSGDVTVTGSVQQLRLELSGAGRVDARELQAREARVTISGSGTSVIRVRDRLIAVLSGSGSLDYFGDPLVTQTVTGTGRVERAGN